MAHKPTDKSTADCRCLLKNTSAVVEIEFERVVCVELYRDYKDLGRFMLRSGGATIAAGMVEEVAHLLACHFLVLLVVVVFRFLFASCGTGARCSSVVRVFPHGAMGRRIDPSWWTH